jgi:hypothetical protein
MTSFRRISTALVALLALAGSRGAIAQQAPRFSCSTGIHAGETLGFVAVPEGDLFCPLVADPKDPHSFLSLIRGDFPTLTELENDTDVGSVGLADQFSFARWGGSRPGDGIQIGISGGVFAQFDLRAASFDLINADYIVGIPVTFRKSGFSLRARPYHQSSHLGDEFLLRGGDFERENLSFEALEVILSQEAGPVRVYGGGEWLFRREPETLKEYLAHGGLELRAGASDGPKFVAAVDVKSTEEQDWEPGWSVRTGIEMAVWRDHGHPPRQWQILAELYQGPAPYGQFFQENLRWLGVGVHFSL